MTRDEILKKDWQLLTAYSEMKTISYLRTIMDNQAVIISELKNIPLKDVTEQMKNYEKENYSEVVKQVKDNIPDYSDHKPCYNEYKKL